MGDTSMSGKNVVVLGSGGREHALAYKLAQSDKVERVFVIPGNGGTASGKIENKTVALTKPDFTELRSFCKDEKIDLVVVGPEQPLVDGVVDALEKDGIKSFGPSMAAAELEGSKAFCKSFFDKYNIPTAKSKTVTSLDEGIAYVKQRESEKAPLQVVKASGLAAGKGVIVPTTVDESIDALKEMFDGKFGSAGEEVVLEDLLTGPEVSIFGMCDGKTVKAFMPAQDHKRALDGDKGLNTGGMGAYAPAPICNAEMQKDILENILQKCVDGMAAEGKPYKGLMYAGLMLTPNGPQMLEINCRFGDPETQYLYDLMVACAEGTLSTCSLDFHENQSACVVVLAAGGYPGSYKKGMEITGLPKVTTDDVCVFHAGTKFDAGKTLSSGGRVLGVTARADSLRAAVDKAYALIGTKNNEGIKFETMQFRTDIAHRALTPSLGA